MIQVGYQDSVVNDILNKIKFPTYWNTSKLKFVAKYQPYLEYIDSGIEWLGRIPSHWDYTRFKFIAIYKKAGLPKKLVVEPNNNYPVYMTMDYLRGGLPTQWVADQDIEIVSENEIALLWDGANAGEFFKTRKGVLPSTVAKIDFFKIDKNYGWYFTTILEKILRSETTGMGIPHVNGAILSNSIVAVPPLQEQTQIAQFLDYETAKIDLLIEKQQKLIELLKEKRQAVISHAVTKGLDPNVEMKDSGVEWLGEVPAHWEIKTHKYIFNLNPKKSELSKELMESYCTFLPMEKLKLNSLTIDETRLVKDVYDGYTYFKDGDILLAKVTPCFENKNMAIAQGLQQGIGFGSSEIYVIRVNSDVNAQYIFYRLQEEIFIQIAISNMTGAGGLKRVPSEFISNYLIALPDIQEQTQIAKYLDTQTSKIDLLIEKAEAQIALMQERRTALISAAVTGKMDLRHWQMPEASNHQGGDYE